MPEDSSLSLNYKPGEKWDQFAENEKRFGVKTDFHEELYTTVLDKSGADFKKKEEQAARLAKEIEKVFFDFVLDIFIVNRALLLIFM